MTVPVLTAVTDAVWEADLVQALERSDLGLSVVRRCVDLADLLSAASAGTARAALLSSDLRRLDRSALDRLAAAGVAVVGLVGADDEHAERRLRQLGVTHVLAADSEPSVLAEAVLAAVAGPVERSQQAPRRDLADPVAALPDLADLPPPASSAVDLPPGPVGSVVAVWGPTGAPGRTTVAVNLAVELAALGVSTMLVDADVYGGVVSQFLGMLDESPGVATAARFANNGSLDVPRLADICRQVADNLVVLTGLPRADRWPELRPSAMEAVLMLARRLASVVVVDCGFCLETDEELAYDTAAPRRNGATLAVLQEADTVLAVGAADPVGLQRLVRGAADLREAVPGATPTVVLTRLRSSVVPGRTETEVRAALERYAGLTDVVTVPYDLAGHDKAVALGKSLREVAPDSPARKVYAALARELGGVPAAETSRRRRREKVKA